MRFYCILISHFCHFCRFVASKTVGCPFVVSLRACSHHSFGTGTQPGARVHTRSTVSGRSGTSRPPRDVIAVEQDRNVSSCLCGVNGQPDAFRSRLASQCVIMTNIQYILPKSVCLVTNPHILMDSSISALASKHLGHLSNLDAIRTYPLF